jgi:hypothetical protein
MLIPTLEHMKRYYMVATMCDPTLKDMQWPGCCKEDADQAKDWFVQEFTALWDKETKLERAMKAAAAEKSDQSEVGITTHAAIAITSKAWNPLWQPQTSFKRLWKKSNRLVTVTQQIETGR